MPRATNRELMRLSIDLPLKSLASQLDVPGLTEAFIGYRINFSGTLTLLLNQELGPLPPRRNVLMMHKDGTMGFYNLALAAAEVLPPLNCTCPQCAARA